jgi:3-oxoacyl-[acyl-carrier protein] reductase
MGTKIALVTGASRGIGASIAERLAKDGFYVYMNFSKNVEQAQKTASNIKLAGCECELLKFDLLNENEIKDSIKNIEQRWGKLNILVNCAGIMKDEMVEDTSSKSWHKVLDINLTGMFIVTRESLRLLKNAEYGRIINIGSQVAFTGSKSHAHYAASKAGMLGFSYSLAKELGGNNITVNVISPGRVNTDMIGCRQNGRLEEWIQATPIKRLGYPKEIAAAVSFLAGEESSYITGANINVNGGLLMG